MPNVDRHCDIPVSTTYFTLPDMTFHYHFIWPTFFQTMFSKEKAAGMRHFSEQFHQVLSRHYFTLTNCVMVGRKCVELPKAKCTYAAERGERRERKEEEEK